MDGDISGMLRQVMDNPQFGAMMQAVKSQLGGEDGGVDPVKMMEKLPELMTMLGPALGAMGQMPPSGNRDTPAMQEEPSADAKREDTPADAKRDDAGPDTESRKDPDADGKSEGNTAGNQFFRPGNRDKRNKLLCALKPYLSPARCALVDRAMSAMQLGELLGTVMPPKS